MAFEPINRNYVFDFHFFSLFSFVSTKRQRGTEHGRMRVMGQRASTPVRDGSRRGRGNSRTNTTTRMRDIHDNEDNTGADAPAGGSTQQQQQQQDAQAEIPVGRVVQQAWEVRTGPDGSIRLVEVQPASSEEEDEGEADSLEEDEEFFEAIDDLDYDNDEDGESELESMSPASDGEEDCDANMDVLDILDSETSSPRYNMRSRTKLVKARNKSSAASTSKGDGEKEKSVEAEQRQHSFERLKGILQAHVAWEGGSPKTHTDMARLMRSRESTGHWSPSKRTRVSSRVLPQGDPEVVDLGNSRAYIGHFAENGNVFVAGFQNQTIRLYEVNETHKPWKLRKEIVPRALNWTITDTCMSPNQQLLVYATISPVLHAVNINATDDITSVQNITDLHTPLDFGEGFSEGAFGLWAINFSGDGKYILAGSSDYATYIYDLAAQRVVSKASAHKDDVNTVCFADENDHVYLSGSDDCMIKVWDRRCGEGGVSRAQGILPGHTEGLTYISPKGDGRYFISNGKDQKCKLWDIRCMSSSSNSQIKKGRFPKFYWDYRWQPYPGNPSKVKHPQDRSLATFTGHRVLQTLIRCRWSPAETTGQRYIFSGSQCGSLFVYDIITGETAAVFKFHRSVMRDCDWHPNQPLIASVGWDGSVVIWRKMPEHEGQTHNLSKREDANRQRHSYVIND